MSVLDIQQPSCASLCNSHAHETMMEILYMNSKESMSFKKTKKVFYSCRLIWKRSFKEIISAYKNKNSPLQKMKYKRIRNDTSQQ